MAQFLVGALLGACTGGWWSRRKAVASAVAAAVASARAEATAHAQQVVMVGGSNDDDGRTYYHYDAIDHDDDDCTSVDSSERMALRSSGSGHLDRVGSRSGSVGGVRSPESTVRELMDAAHDERPF